MPSEIANSNPYKREAASIRPSYYIVNHTENDVARSQVEWRILMVVTTSGSVFRESFPLWAPNGRSCGDLRRRNERTRLREATLRWAESGARSAGFVSY